MHVDVKKKKKTFSSLNMYMAKQSQVVGKVFSFFKSSHSRGGFFYRRFVAVFVDSCLATTPKVPYIKNLYFCCKCEWTYS